MIQAHLQCNDTNETYLTAALTWLRLKLQVLGNEGVATDVEVTQAQQKTSRSWFTRKPEPTARAKTSVGDFPKVSSADVSAAEQALLSAEQAEPPPALIVLAQYLGLSPFEQRLLLLCVGMELDTRLPQLCAHAQHDPRKPFPTFALAFNLFTDLATWDALSPERPLRYWRLLEISQSGTTPLTGSALRADERAVNFLKGLNELDERLVALLAPVRGTTALMPSQKAVVKQVAAYLDTQLGNNRQVIVQLAGLDAASKQQVMLMALRSAALPYLQGLQPLKLLDSQIPTGAEEFETFARLWARESLLLPLALYMVIQDDVSNPAERLALVTRLLERIQGVVFLDTREIRADVGNGCLCVEVRKPTPVEQRVAWRVALNEEKADIASRLAGQFNFNVSTVEAVVRQVATECKDPQQREQVLRQVCLAKTRKGMDKLAQRVDAKATWDRLVLPSESLHLLQNIAAQVGQRHRVYDEWGFRKLMNRGLGISALFAGESGTGKTMAAEVIANALGLDLYRVDLSAVVSKYIGETEKNLRRVFDAAEEGGAILFFDEADALFGKRSEVKDSHDRYANIEVNYLLQRMEAFGGLAILATNLKKSLDQAFTRRLRFIVNFPFPGAEERQCMWKTAFPDSLPLAESLDYARLAKFSLTGGSIHNIALNAAFLAAQAGAAGITMQHVLDATKLEYRKLEKTVNEQDFRVLEPVRKRA